jgi:hypothetical protein
MALYERWIVSVWLSEFPAIRQRRIAQEFCGGNALFESGVLSVTTKLHAYTAGAPAPPGDPPTIRQRWIAQVCCDDALFERGESPWSDMISEIIP